MRRTGTCRAVLLVLFFALALSLASCGRAAKGSVEGYPWEIGPESRYDPAGKTTAALTVDETTLLEDTTVFTVGNGGTETLTSDFGYTLEIELEGKWYEIPCEFDIPAAEFQVAPGESEPFAVYWSDSYGTLPDGHYRLVKEFRGGYKQQASCEFTIAR